MAAYHGKDARAYFTLADGAATAFVLVRSWTCTLNCATADTTGMAANGRLQAVGLKSGTCSVECTYDGATYAQVDETDNNVYSAGVTGIKVELLRTTADAAKGYSGGAICTSVDVSTSIDGTPIITYNFMWTGTVTATTTAGT